MRIYRYLLLFIAIIISGCASNNLQTNLIQFKSTESGIVAINLESSTIDSSDKILKTINSPTLLNMIESHDYFHTSLSNNYGNLQYESLIVSYPIKKLSKFYRSKICDALYLVNCKNNIKMLNKFTNIDLDRESAIFVNNIESVEVYKIKYTAPNAFGESVVLSGSILIPNNHQTKVNGVVIMYHFTALDKRNIPSNPKGDYFRNTPLIAATIASGNYVVLMPDYSGFGSDESSVHPYVLYPEVNALSGIYMLNALQQMTRKVEYQKIDNKILLFSSGYSEGAAYSMWSNKILEENPDYLNQYSYKISGVMPISGAYDLSKTTLNYLLNSHESEALWQDSIIEKLSRPGLIANVLTSYNAYSLNNKESAIFNNKFTFCSDLSAESESCSPSNIIAESGSEYKKYMDLYRMARKTGYGESGDSILPLINPTILSDGSILSEMIKADIYNLKSSNYINLISLESDMILSESNSYIAFLAMAKQHGNVSLTIVPNASLIAAGLMPFTDVAINHQSFFIYAYLILRKIIDDRFNVEMQQSTLNNP